MTLDEAKKLMPFDLFVNKALPTLLAEFREILGKQYEKLDTDEKKRSHRDTVTGEIKQLMDTMRESLLGADPLKATVALAYLSYDVALHMAETGQLDENYLRKLADAK